MEITECTPFLLPRQSFSCMEIIECLLFCCAIAAVQMALVVWQGKKESALALSKKKYGGLLIAGDILLMLLALYRESQGGYPALWCFVLWSWLFGLSIYDLKFRELPGIQNLLPILFYGFFWVIGCQPIEWKNSIIMVIVLASSMGLVYLIRKDAIGLGDIKLILVCGIYAGTACAGILIRGLTAAFLCGIGLLLSRKATAKTELPFVPFLFLGALFV